jgi:hypothetical protein
MGAIIKASNGGSKGGTGGLEGYLKKEGKTEEKLMYGKDCDVNNFAKDFQATKELYNKTDGRQHTHFIQSWRPGEVTAKQANEIGQEFLKHEKFNGFQAVVITHIDRENIHNHIVINSVNLETGLKYHQTKQEYQLLKDFSNQINLKYEITPEPKIAKEGDIRVYDNKFKYQKLKEHEQNKGKSYVYETKNAVDKALETATNKKEFIEQMKEQGYKTSWTESRKNITFENENGEKVRLSNLQKTFSDEKYSREGLKKEFELVKTPKIAIEPLQEGGTQTEVQKNTEKGLNGDFVQSKGQSESISDLKKLKTEILLKLEQGEKLVKTFKILESAKESFETKLKNIEIPEQYSLFDKISGKAKELETEKQNRISEIKKDIENIELKQKSIKNQLNGIGKKTELEKELKELEEKIKTLEKAEIEKKREIAQKKIQELEEKRVEKTSKKVEFYNEITGKIIFVETKTFENGQMETRSSAAKEPFKQQIGNYIEYKNLIAAAKELINNNYIAVKETNKTEKGLEEKNLDQEFNKILKEKIQELEKQKKPERDLGFSR